MSDRPTTVLLNRFEIAILSRSGQYILAGGPVGDWSIIDDSQTANWQSVDDNQESSWTAVNDMNNVVWAEIPA